MKNLVFILFFTCTCLQANAQHIPDYSTVKDGTPEQRIARANEAALQAATYLLSVPPDTNNKDVNDASQYLLLWMTETSDYNFELDDATVQLYIPNRALLPVLLAAMVEYEMKKPENKDDMKKVRMHAAKKLIQYAQDPANKVNMPDGLKKAAIAEKNGELNKYLASFDKK